MWPNGEKRYMDRLFVKNKIIGNEEKGNIQQSIKTSTSCISKGL